MEENEMEENEMEGKKKEEKEMEEKEMEEKEMVLLIITYRLHNLYQKIHTFNFQKLKKKKQL